jgi:hypothetical protein
MIVYLITGPAQTGNKESIILIGGNNAVDFFELPGDSSPSALKHLHRAEPLPEGEVARATRLRRFMLTVTRCSHAL